MDTLKGPPIDIFTLTETLNAAEELKRGLSMEEARQIAFAVITAEFPALVREHLKNQ